MESLINSVVYISFYYSTCVDIFVSLRLEAVRMNGTERNLERQIAQVKDKFLWVPLIFDIYRLSQLKHTILLFYQKVSEDQSNYLHLLKLVNSLMCFEHLKQGSTS